MNKKIIVWGREFDLSINFDIYANECITETQNKALENFLCRPDLIENAKEKVIAYCLKHNGNEIGSSIENIFKYVIPQSIYIQRAPDNTRTVGLMCAYKFNPDDGLAIVFKDEKLIAVGSQNIIL